MHPAFRIQSVCILYRGPLRVDLLIHNMKLIIVNGQHVLKTTKLAPTRLRHGMSFLELIRTRVLENGIFAICFGYHRKCFVQAEAKCLHIRGQRFRAFRSLNAQILEFFKVFDNRCGLILRSDGDVQRFAPVLQIG